MKNLTNFFIRLFLALVSIYVTFKIVITLGRYIYDNFPFAAKINVEFNFLIYFLPAIIYFVGFFIFFIVYFFVFKKYRKINENLRKALKIIILFHLLLMLYFLIICVSYLLDFDLPSWYFV